MGSAASIVVILVCIPLSFIVAAMCYPIYALLRKIFYVPLVRKKLIKKAMEDGHTIIAHRSYDKKVFPRFHYTKGKESDVFFFEVNGRTYRRYLTSLWSLPDEVTLYYQKSPHKADVAEAFGLKENPTWFLQYLVLVAICMVIFYLVGMNYVQIYI